MPAASDAATRKAEFHEDAAVKLSLWVGGAALAALKGFAYLATGSLIVRASTFDSLGDIVSSAIMMVTQTKANDQSDIHAYPVGKGRFSALGVLFFCAFMCSTMSSMAIDCLSELLKSEDGDEQSASDALQRLFDEQPKLQNVYGKGSHSDFISKYGGGDGGGDLAETILSLKLLSVCVLAKFLLFLYCRSVVKLRESEIIKPLATDHLNDTITNAVCTSTVLLISTLEGRGYEGAWMEKIDPGVSLVLAIWIIWGWISNALEQLTLLSDRRNDDADVEAMGEAARQALSDCPLELRSADCYHAGEGLRVRLEFSPAANDPLARRLVGAIHEAEKAVCGATEDDVHGIDVRLVPIAKDA